ncbi:thioredoxin domain-containing protein [Pseudonocardia sp. MCCB 268]|nr:thioredoxin domain-containing protein [Pseudonocardia cytotoxica]
MGRSERGSARPPRPNSGGQDHHHRGGRVRGAGWRSPGSCWSAALTVGAYVAWQDYSAPVEPAYAVARDGVVVYAGNPATPVTVDVYEDYLCPACKRFQADLRRRSHGRAQRRQGEGQLPPCDPRRPVEPTPGATRRVPATRRSAPADARIFPAFRMALHRPAGRGGADPDRRGAVAWGTELGATGTSRTRRPRGEHPGIADATGRDRGRPGRRTAVGSSAPDR